MPKRPTTPPWTFRSVGSINEVTARWGDQDWVIAKLDSKSLGWHEDSYSAMLENDANARLIAAAPETAAERDRLKEVNAQLLAALRKMAALAEPYNHISASQEEQHYVATCGSVKGFIGITVGDLRRARAAIAKAEGKP